MRGRGRQRCLRLKDVALGQGGRLKESCSCPKTNDDECTGEGYWRVGYTLPWWLRVSRARLGIEDHKPPVRTRPKCLATGP